MLPQLELCRRFRETGRRPKAHAKRSSIHWAALAAVVLLLTLAGVAQEKPPARAQKAWSEEMKKYPGLMEEFGQLQTKILHEVQFPAERSHSRLLPLLPEGTVFYAALPNYGDALHQALTVFQHEREQSPVLRDWWQHGPAAENGPKIEEYLQKVDQVSQYLGNEIVVSERTTADRAHPSLLIVAEVLKPGLKEVLQQTAKELSGKANPSVRVLDLTELADAKEASDKDLVILVRPDLLVAGLDVATLRSFNARIERNASEFLSTAFGQRLAQAYEGGTGIVAAADLQRVLNEAMPSNDPNRKNLERSGFSDVKYLVWEHKSVSGQPGSQIELSFTGPRRGVASWLAAPATLGSLDFVSQKAVVAGAVLLKNPAEIYDDVVELATASNPNAFASVTQMEQGLKLSLKGDLFSLLGGEIGYEVDSFTPPGPVWKVILKVNDAPRLQTTLNTLMAAGQMKAEKTEEDGLVYQTLRIPAGQKSSEIHYVFVDGYLIVASSQETVAEAVRLHKSGESLAKSESFLASLPPGHSSEASGLLYEDPMAMATMTLRQQSPEIADLLSQTTTKKTPVVMAAYGEESAIREASKSSGVDAGGVLVIAAIAIPNLLRARIAANESSAVASIRTMNTAQITYASVYQERGFARDLSTLGPGEHEPSTRSASHAGFIDSTLGNVKCTAGAWCEKSGFRFMVVTACKTQRCREFVAIATPVSSSTGTRNFCSTSDAVVRFKIDSPLTAPITATQCRAWAPLQ